MEYKSWYIYFKSCDGGRDVTYKPYLNWNMVLDFMFVVYIYQKPTYFSIKEIDNVLDERKFIDLCPRLRFQILAICLLSLH